MQEKEKTYLEKLKENRKKRKKLHIIGGLCGVLVAAGVFGTLVLPGLGLDGANQTLICEKTEHTHDTCAEDCSLEAHTHGDECYATTADESGEGEYVNQGLVVQMQPVEEDGKGATGEPLSVWVMSTYSKANTEVNMAKVRLSVGKLPDGVSVAGFDENNEMQVEWQGTDQYITLKIVQATDDSGETYIEFEQPEGSILEFNVQLNSQNGIMPKETTATVSVKDVTGLAEGTTVSLPEGVTLTWNADHAWKNVVKKVDLAKITVANNKLLGALTYTITAESSNNEATGEIWTDYVELEDTLTLPAGIYLPDGAKVSGDKIVTSDGSKTILSFTDLTEKGGTVTELTIVDTQKIAYKVQVPNTHRDDKGVLTAEQDNLSLTMVLQAELLKLEDGYTPTGGKTIKNAVTFKSVPYKPYDVTPTTATVATQPELKKEEFSVKKYVTDLDTSVKGALAGEEVEYTIKIINTGAAPIAVKDDEGKLYQVKDQLSDYLYLTDEQITALKSVNAEYYEKEKDRYILWTPSATDIAPGAELSLTFKVTVRSKQQLQEAGVAIPKDGTMIHNTAIYKDRNSLTVDIAYRNPTLTIEKTAMDSEVDGSLSAHNGEKITYTITVTGDKELDSKEETIVEDTLPAGLTFVSTSVTDGFKRDGQNLTWNIGCVKANEVKTITYKCTVNTDELDAQQKITNIAKITDGSSTCLVGIDYPITLDKEVTKASKINADGKEEDLTLGLSEAYESGTVFDYTITLSNDATHPSTKANMVLEDLLPIQMLPYGYTLYQVDSNNNKTAVTDSDPWSSYVRGSLNMDDYTYVTEIDNATVQLERVDGNKVKLIWTVATPEAGKSCTVSYRAQIKVGETESSRSFENVATVDGVGQDKVTVFGGQSVGTIKITKYFKLHNNNSNNGESAYAFLLGDKETDERWDNIKFRLVGVDPKDSTKIVYDSTINMTDFTKATGSDCYEITLKNVPIGNYTLTEIGYEDSNYEKVSPWMGYCEKGGDGEWHWQQKPSSSMSFKVTTSAWTYLIDYNRYYTKTTVNLQKSVYAIVQEDKDGNWTYLTDKYLFETDDDPDTKTLVIYDITVSAVGSQNVIIESLTDQLPDGLEFCGVNAKSGEMNRNSFGTNRTLSDEIDNLVQQSDLNQEGLKLRSGTRIINAICDEGNKVTFKFDFGSSDTLTDGDVSYYRLRAGKAFTFLMLCEVDDDQIVAGQDLTNTVELTVNGASGLSDSPEYTMINTPCDSIQNNGDATIVSQDEETGSMTVQSYVTISPEETIVPGIEKNATAYLKQKTSIEIPLGENTNIVANAAVKWEITLHNNGTEDMSNYKVQDMVTSPFHIMSEAEATGFSISAPISFQLYDYNGNPVEGKCYTDISYNTLTSSDTSVNCYEFNFSDEKYAIPVGHYAVLTVYTNNTKGKNQIYKNTATLIPSQSFKANRVRYGELTTDANGTYNGVSSSDYVYALGKYASISWKTITEKGNTKNTAKGNSDKNYISVDRNSNYVIYTNNVQNISENSFNQLVMIDLMPMVNDTGVINRNDKRGSAFSVLYNGGLTIQVLDSKGKVAQTLVQDTDYTLEFSAKTGFTEGDFAGNTSASWHSQWKEDDRSFRIVLNDEFYLNPQYTLVVTYEGEIDSAATPGTIAWNSFGYQYCANGLDEPVRAEPPKVGVMIPTIPIIQKEVIDSYGNVQERDAEIEFKFALWDAETYESDPANAKICEFTVCQGGYKELSNLGEGITLENGKTYMITELTDQMPEDYELVGIGEKGGTLEESYTFTYYNNKDIRILAKNRIDNYRSELPSTGGMGTKGYTTAGLLLMFLAVLLCGGKIVATKKKERRI